MSYPANKVHRKNRRKLGRGQYPTSNAVTVTATGSGSTAIVTYNQPVNVSGPLAITVATLTFVSQVINSPTQVTVTMSGAVSTHAYTIAANDPHVSSYQGGPTLGTSGTF
jgi:hypothetical protein